MAVLSRVGAHLREVIRFAPTRPAFQAGLRAAVATLVPVIAVRVLELPHGHWLSLGAYFASIADKGGAYRARARAMVGTALACSAAVVLGELCSGQLWLLPVTSVWVLGCMYMGIYGVAATGVGTQAGIAFAIAVATPAITVREAAWAGGAVVAGALWAMVLSLGLWPVRRYRAAQRAISGCVDGLRDYAARLRRLAEAGPEREDAQAPVLSRLGPLRERLEEARGILALTRRARAESAKGERLLVVLEALDALFGVMTALGEALATAGADPVVRRLVPEALDGLAGELEVLAVSVKRQRGGPAPEEQHWGGGALREIAVGLEEEGTGTALEHASRLQLAALLERARQLCHAMQEAAADPDAVEGRTPRVAIGPQAVTATTAAQWIASDVATAEEGGAASRASDVGSPAVLSPRADAGGASPRAGAGAAISPASKSATGPGSGSRARAVVPREPVPPVRVWLWEPLRDNLSLDSVVLRHALRVSLTMTIAVGIVTLFPSRYSHWITLTVFAVMLPHTGATFLKTLQRVLGTVIGSLLALAVTSGVHDERILLPIVFTTVILGVGLLPVNYGLYTVFVTITFVLLTEMGSGSWDLATIRLEHTAIGAGVALLASFILWEVPEKHRFSQHLAVALRVGQEFLRAAVASALRGEGEGTDPTVALARRRFGQELLNAEASFQRLLSEPRAQGDEVEARMALLAFARRYAAAVVALGVSTSEPLSEGGQVTVRSITEGIEKTLADLANAVAERRRPSPLPPLGQPWGDRRPRDVAALATEAPVLEAKLERIVRQVSVMHAAASR